MIKNRTNFDLSVYYFIIFFGFGGFFPLLSVFLKNNLHLSGTQIGTIMSIGPIIFMLTQPLWGMICDYTRRPRTVLAIAIVITGAAGIPYMFTSDYGLLLFVAASLAVFQSAIIPISDSIAINYTQRLNTDYGNIRLWGALGFAVAAYFMGELSEWTGLKVIFICFTVSMLIGTFFVHRMPKEGGELHIDLRSGLSRLIKIPKFTLFIVATFLVFGPIQANNVYFGLFIDHVGGSIAAVGFAFLLAAGTEAPFMRLSGPWIRKHGFLLVTILAALVSCIRWLFYFYEPSVTLVFISTLAQGFSVGLFIPAALSYVKDIAPKEVSITAVSIYSAVGSGLGNWFCVFLGGIILDLFSIFAVYLFFAILTLIGLVLLTFLLRYEKLEKSRYKLDGT